MADVAAIEMLREENAAMEKEIMRLTKGGPAEAATATFTEEPRGGIKVMIGEGSNVKRVTHVDPTGLA